MRPNIIKALTVGFTCAVALATPSLASATEYVGTAGHDYLRVRAADNTPHPDVLRGYGGSDFIKFGDDYSQASGGRGDDFIDATANGSNRHSVITCGAGVDVVYYDRSKYAGGGYEKPEMSRCEIQIPQDKLDDYDLPLDVRRDEWRPGADLEGRVVFGLRKDDAIMGTTRGDVLVGGAGNDSIDAVLDYEGPAQWDAVAGGPGDDTIVIGHGKLRCGSGYDTVVLTVPRRTPADCEEAERYQGD